MKSAADPDARLFAPQRHGDEDAEPGLVDFAVNVRGAPPQFVRDALIDEIDTLASYPSSARELQVRSIVGAAHGRPAQEVLLLAGAAEGFELLTHLHARHAALVIPSFTEPGRVLSAAGVRITEVACTGPDWRLDLSSVPGDADLVVIGNPTNPTSVLHPRTDIEALARPGRIVVVDEAFADLTCAGVGDGLVMEPETVAGQRDRNLIVIRSVTKTFGLAGLRAGYLLAAPDIIAQLTRTRRHWAVSSPAIAAIGACLGTDGLEYARAEALRVRTQRAELLRRLRGAGLDVVGAPAAPFVTVRVPDALTVKEQLRHKGFGVRSCANFAGLGRDYLRLAVRDDEQSAALVRALSDCIDSVDLERQW